MKTKRIYCICDGWDCPYYKNGECGLEKPLKKCYDFAYFGNGGDDYICENEERVTFE